jgi:FAD/FMN-containing dehydrogenase
MAMTFLPKIDGRVIVPGHPDYDSARAVFAGGVDHRPVLIARVADARDIARVITYARERQLELAVRSGGHSPVGHGVSDGGIVIDLRDLRGLEIDAEGRMAWAGSGLTAGEYSAATGAHGLATGFGDTASVGLGGITLSGGVGYLVRKHGLAIDNLLAADVVTADGEILRVDDRSHPDLFWAIRGGGGNFGVAARFRFRLHPVDQVVGGMLVLPATPETIRSFLAAADAAPDELSTIASVMLAPPLPFLTPQHHGRPVLMTSLAYAGAVDDGERALAPFRAIAKPLADLLRPMPYPELLATVPDGYRPRTASRTMFVDALDDHQAGTMVERVAASTAPMAAAQLRVLGGAMARVPEHATAFAHRRRRVMVTVAAMFARADEEAAHDAWAARLAAELRTPDHGAYVGFLADDESDGVRAAYPGATWNRLAAIKAQYDPDNVFRLNHNVPPADERAAA